MHKFNTGDIIIALNSKQCKINPRVEGEAYRVYGTMKCPKCQEDFVCINDKHFDQTMRIKCSSCSCTDIYSNHVWTLASNFRSQNHFDPYEELEQAIKREDYMRAAELRDMINADHERQRN